MEPQKEKLWSLPHLQNVIKRDPEAYEGEFTIQQLHFESTLEVFLMKPQKPAKNFNEQVMFLAHVTPCYPGKNVNFHGRIISMLEEHYRILHPLTRKTLVSALMLLRKRDAFPILDMLPLCFKLFTLDDKVLRSTIFSHIVRDILNTNQKSKDQQWNREVQGFFFKQIKSQDMSVVRKAASIIIALYKKRIWTDDRCVNMISTLCLCKDTRVATAAIRFLLGHTADLDEEVQSDEEKMCEEANEAAKEVVGKRVKKSKASVRKLKRVKKSAKRLLEKRSKKKSSFEAIVSFAALDVLHDPQSLVERLLQRVMKQGDKFKFRILALQLISRLVGRHELLLVNLYPYLLKYLTPHQREVTHILACLAMSCHALVPPEELSPVVTHLINTFVNETCAKEVLAVGLNAVREVCFRQPLVLTEEQLSNLADFRKFKDKGVVMAAKSLLNLYREVNPAMLHRSLRGKEAAMALSRGELAAPEYAKERSDGIDGLELFASKMLRPKKSVAESESDMDSDASELESEEEGVSANCEEANILPAPEKIEEPTTVSEENKENAPTESAPEIDQIEEPTTVSEENKENAPTEGAPEIDQIKEPITVPEENKENAPTESAPEIDQIEEPTTVSEENKASILPLAEKIDQIKEPKENAPTESAPETLQPTKVVDDLQTPLTEKEKVQKLAMNLATETVFGSKQFAKMRKLSMKQSLEWQLGKKRAREADLSDSESSPSASSNDGSESEEEAPATGWDVLNPDDLKTSKTRKKGKAARLESILKGREDRPAFGRKKKERRGGSTNKEKRRNQPMIMTLRKNKMKTMEKSCIKLRNERKHIKEMKRKTNKRRR